MSTEYDTYNDTYDEPFVSVYFAEPLDDKTETNLYFALCRQFPGIEFGMGDYYANVYSDEPEVYKKAAAFIESFGIQVTEIAGGEP